MEIGLSIVYEGNNYGMLLQAYATQYVLDSMGYHTEIIGYKRDGLKGIHLSLGLIADMAVIAKRKFENKFKKKINLDSEHKRNIEQRKREALRFAEKHLHDIHLCKGYDELVEYGSHFDAVIVGSDQLWLPECVFGNLRTLRFVPDNVRKISYATSVGVSKYPFYCKSSARQFLDRFDYISVREEQGKKIIEELCTKRVEVVLDPTYLIEKETWESLIPAEREISEPYVLCYFIGNNCKSKEIASKISKEHGYKVISILSDESVSDIDLTYADEVISGASPERFVNLIRNADYIMTDSFHGIAFSIINEKNFYVFYRHATDSSDSRNSRIDNILNTWKLQDRLVTEYNSDHIEITDIDYDIVNRELQNRRIHSLNYLERALNE